MRVYLDDNITDRRVVAQLQRMGHRVRLPTDVGQSGASDAKHLNASFVDGRVGVW